MAKRVLIVGGGGREDALAYIVSQSSKVSKIFCAPGNAGIAQRGADCIEIKPTEIQALSCFAEKNQIDLTIIGPEAPLVAGIVDEFVAKGLKIMGPTKAAARIEGSKVWAKRMMRKYGVPTAPFEDFDDPEKARDYLENPERIPCVVKADGLAAGKGSFRCFTKEQGREAIERIMVKKESGEAGNQIVIEELLEGEEATFMVFTGGNRIIPMPSTQDHKPVFDRDQGLNTGGMGAYAPVPLITPSLEEEIVEKIIYPILSGMQKEGIFYQGILYAGLMITLEGPKLLECNCRFGDPELQPIALLAKSDLIPLLEEVAEGQIKVTTNVEWESGSAVCVVMTSTGYPEKYETGKEIKDLAEVEDMEDVVVFHAGTRGVDGKIVTAGGRVLGVTARASGIQGAIDLAYEAVSKISWEGEYHRTDIGQKALRRI